MTTQIDDVVDDVKRDAKERIAEYLERQNGSSNVKSYCANAVEGLSIGRLGTRLGGGKKGAQKHSCFCRRRRADRLAALARPMTATHGPGQSPLDAADGISLSGRLRRPCGDLIEGS